MFLKKCYLGFLADASYIIADEGSGVVAVVLAKLHRSVDWFTVGLFIAVGVVETLIGKQLSDRMNQVVLRRVFAGFLLGMGLLVLGREVPELNADHADQLQAIRSIHFSFSEADYVHNDL